MTKNGKGEKERHLVMVGPEAVSEMLMRLSGMHEDGDEEESYVEMQSCTTEDGEPMLGVRVNDFRVAMTLEECEALADRMEWAMNQWPQALSYRPDIPDFIMGLRQGVAALRKYYDL